MATKKPVRGQSKKKYEKYRNDVKELKRLGLYKGDMRKPITRYAAREAKRFEDVLTGKAAAVKAPKPVAKEYRQEFKAKYRTVIIPRRQNEKVFYDKKSGRVISFREDYGRKITRIIPAHAITPDNVGTLPSGPNVKYVIPLGPSGSVVRFDTWEDLAQFMHQYEVPHFVSGDKYGSRMTQYKNWHKYVEIEIVENPDKELDEDFEE
jgi:hypothetical protein